jgi:hypothetical protein
MKTAGMLLSLIVVLAIGYYFYSVQVAPGPANQVSPKELVDVVGVKNDLLSIAQAERLFLAANGNYGSFEQLQQDGSITFSATNQRSYNFVVEPNSAQGFRATATPADPSKRDWPTLSIDETMELTQR